MFTSPTSAMPRIQATIAQSGGRDADRALISAMRALTLPIHSSQISPIIAAILLPDAGKDALTPALRDALTRLHCGSIAGSTRHRQQQVLLLAVLYIAICREDAFLSDKRLNMLHFGAFMTKRAENNADHVPVMNTVLERLAVTQWLACCISNGVLHFTMSSARAVSHPIVAGRISLSNCAGVLSMQGIDGHWLGGAVFDLDGQTINGLFSRDMHLSRATLRNGTIRAGHFCGADFSHGRFINIKFLDTRFTGVDASRALFDHCAFEQCHFLSCQLKDVKMQACAMSDCRLIKTDMQSAELWGNAGQVNDCSDAANRTQVTCCLFDEVDFRDAIFSHLTFRECNLNGSQLNDIPLSTNRTLRSRMDRAQWHQCTLIACNLSKIVAPQLSLKDVRLYGSNFNNAILRHSRLVRVSFDNCTLSGMSLHRATACNVAFPRTVVLDNIDLREAQLQSVCFSGTADRRIQLCDSLFSASHLQSVVFEYSDFAATSFQRALFVGTTFSHCVLADSHFALAVDLDLVSGNGNELPRSGLEFARVDIAHSTFRVLTSSTGRRAALNPETGADSLLNRIRAYPVSKARKYLLGALLNAVSQKVTNMAVLAEFDAILLPLALSDDYPLHVCVGRFISTRLQANLVLLNTNGLALHDTTPTGWHRMCLQRLVYLLLEQQDPQFILHSSPLISQLLCAIDHKMLPLLPEVRNALWARVRDAMPAGVMRAVYDSTGIELFNVRENCSYMICTTADASESIILSPRLAATKLLSLPFDSPEVPYPASPLPYVRVTRRGQRYVCTNPATWASDASAFPLLNHLNAAATLPLTVPDPLPGPPSVSSL